MQKEKFIVFEGVTCSGKSTIAELLGEYLTDSGIKVLVNYEPTKPIQFLSELTEIERQLLFIADRREDIMKNIAPALKKNQWVIQDRYELSTFAYGMAQGLDFDLLNDCQKSILGDIYLKPDITFFIDIPAELAIRRLKDSGKKVDVYETLQNVKKTSAVYKELLKTNQSGKFVVIDGTKSLDDIFSEIKSHLLK